MTRRRRRFSIRFLLECMFVIAAGLAGRQSVYVGEANRWAGFNVRDGFWGTHFMDSHLYALGNDALGLAIVSTLWFFYASVIAIGVVTLARFCFPRVGIRPRAND